jgi:simple sugar transport system ATP-binding protein
LTPLLEVRGLGKRFGGTIALDGVDLRVAAGEVHAVLGENGAGKTTLMNLLYGLLRPDAGEMTLDGAAWRPASPSDALARGIGMVHQHFMLVERHTVWENVWLAHAGRGRLRLRRDRARRAVRELAERFRLRLDPDAPVETLPVGVRQRVEIAKALARRCRLLILDEPTAVLTPAETRDLFEVVRGLTESGASVLFITHKLDEALRVADRVTVLRRGRVVAHGGAAGADRAELTRAIVGGLRRQTARSPTARASLPGGAPLLSVRGLGSAGGRIAVRDVAFDLRGGEILGVTGVDGNGQDELVALLAGHRRAERGAIALAGEDVTALDVAARWRRGLAVLPGDRRRDGLMLDAPVWENLALREFGAPWARRGALRWVDPAVHRRRAAELIARHDVRAAGPDAPAASLSGGNQQKLLLARELAGDPRVIVLLNPTRGLDVGAAGGLLAELADLRDRGRAVLLFSTELDEVIAHADRWAVMHDGAWREAPRPDPELLGAMMLGGGA